MHRTVGDPCLVRLAVWRWREVHGEHCCSRRRDDNGTGSSRHRNAACSRVTEDVQRSAIVPERVMQRRRPDAEPDRDRGRRHRNGSRNRHGGRTPRAEGHDVLPFGVRCGEDAALQGRRRRRPINCECHRRRGALEPDQLPPAAGTLGEVRLEPRLILSRQRIEGIEG